MCRDGTGLDAAMTFAAWSLGYGSLVGQLERDTGLQLVRFGGSEWDRQAGTLAEVACDGKGEDGNRDTNAFLEREC